MRVAKTVPACGRSTPKATKSAFRPLPTPSPRNRPTTDASRPITNPSTTTDAEHLAARAAERPQRRELAGALRDGDRQRVEDDERTDEERDTAEAEQEVR